MESILQATALYAGILVWDPTDAEAFEILTEQPAPADPVQAIQIVQDTLLALPEAEPGNLHSAVLTESDRASLAQLLQDLKALSGR